MFGIGWLKNWENKMPYIKSGDGRREALQRGEPALNAGELNYQIFYYHKYQYINNTSMDFQQKIKFSVDQFLGKAPNYQRWNDMTGALIRCHKEILRRLGKTSSLYILMEKYDKQIADYEDLKILENGDV
jgi:hypothetical protein